MLVLVSCVIEFKQDLLFFSQIILLSNFLLSFLYSKFIHIYKWFFLFKGCIFTGNILCSRPLTRWNITFVYRNIYIYIVLVCFSQNYLNYNHMYKQIILSSSISHLTMTVIDLCTITYTLWILNYCIENHLNLHWFYN